LTLLADMGDPVLAPYTPVKWRDKALMLESLVCHSASMISVTSEAAKSVLHQRHGISDDRVVVVQQGFDPTFVAASNECEIDFDAQRLELLYTGSFYSFRRAEALLDAVRSVPGVRLTVATVLAPEYLTKAADCSQGNIRILGFLPHRVALAAQRRCDVLVNLANADPVQVPGKVYEYFGAGRPILHLRGEEQDVVGELLGRVGGGISIPASVDEIKEALSQMKLLKFSGELKRSAECKELVEAYSWQSLASKWISRLCDALEKDSSTDNYR
jgi:glycosyltransferase involved in cell wall biosynthesis